MPHKRAKLSVRRENSKNSDLPPTGNLTLSQEDVPKSLLRVLQAEQVRKRFREKRAREGEESISNRDRKRQKKEHGSESLVIRRNESLKQFNRRVEEEMRTQVAEAMQSSRSVTRKATKEAKEAKKARIAAAQGKSKTKEVEENRATDALVETVPRKPAAEMDFAKADQRRRLNDIVQAPPALTKLPRGVKSTTTETAKTEVISMAQKHMMEVERERAVKRYRELKEKRLAQKET